MQFSRYCSRALWPAWRPTSCRTATGRWAPVAPRRHTNFKNGLYGHCARRRRTTGLSRCTWGGNRCSSGHINLGRRRSSTTPDPSSRRRRSTSARRQWRNRRTSCRPWSTRAPSTPSPRQIWGPARAACTHPMRSSPASPVLSFNHSSHS
jgi:hypothetical protein